MTTPKADRARTINMTIAALNARIKKLDSTPHYGTEVTSDPAVIRANKRRDAASKRFSTLWRANRKRSGLDAADAARNAACNAVRDRIKAEAVALRSLVADLLTYALTDTPIPTQLAARVTAALKENA